MIMAKLLFLSGSAASMVRFRSAFLTALVEAGHRVVVATPVDEPEWVDRLKAIGVSVVPLRLNRTGLNPWADFKTLMALRRIIREQDPERILAYAHKPVLYGLAVSGGRPFFGMLTGLGYVFTGGGLKRRLIRAAFRCVYPPLLRSASALLFLNPDDAEVFTRGGLTSARLRIEVVPGEGIDTNRFPVTPLPAGPVKFLMLARLLRDKGVREYAEAARLVKKRHPEVEFHLAGGTDSNPTAIPAEEVRGWEREGVLTYHGEVSDVRALIAAASVYVLPSYREGMPVSVLEAMACGLPVVATDCGGARRWPVATPVWFHRVRRSCWSARLSAPSPSRSRFARRAPPTHGVTSNRPLPLRPRLVSGWRCTGDLAPMTAARFNRSK